MNIQDHGFPPTRSPSLVLLLDADALDSLSTESFLNDLGIDDVRLARSVRQAMLMIDDTSFDFAYLDFDMDGHETSSSVAERLCAANVPIVVASQADVRLPHHCGRARILRKPFAFEDLKRVLGTA